MDWEVAVIRRSSLCLGAETGTTWALFSEGELQTGSLFTDLRDPNEFSLFEDEVRYALQKNPSCICCDLHPDYITVQLAEQLSAESGLPLYHVPHHLAHALSVRCETVLTAPALCFILDGTGYGIDENIWGFEIIFTDDHSWKRLNHLQYTGQPGGDRAVLEPWRMALSWLEKSLGEETEKYLCGISDRVGERSVRTVLEAIRKNINIPLTSSAGRLFDAFASLTGLSDRIFRPAEAAVRLEQEAGQRTGKPYDLSWNEDGIDARSMVRQAVQDIRNGVSAGEVSARFHSSIADVLFRLAEFYAPEYSVKDIIISGGCFLNELLRNQTMDLLCSAGYKVHINRKYSVTDRNIAVGQAQAVRQGLFDPPGG